MAVDSIGHSQNHKSKWDPEQGPGRRSGTKSTRSSRKHFMLQWKKNKQYWNRHWTKRHLSL